MKKAIYTVITGNYDTLKPINKYIGWDAICFTDDPTLSVTGWTMKVVPVSESPVYQQREIKLLPHKYLPDYDLTIYMDGNMQVLRDPSGLLRVFKGGMMTKKHPKRNCVYAEGQACIEQNKADHDMIRAQMKRYIDLDIPVDYGMYEDAVIVRDRGCVEFCEVWNEELQQQTHRDQLSIAYSIHKTGYRPHAVSHSLISQYFRRSPHQPRKPFTVWFSNPYDPNKNIGAALNEFCDNVPSDDDWICLQDGDIMYLTPDWGNQIYDALKRHGNDFDLIGCVTNRLGATTQTVPGMYDVTDLTSHHEKAVELSKSKWAEVMPVEGGIAGMFMLFKKSLWKKYKFAENNRKFDTDFSKRLIADKKRIGIMTGLYVLHLYRLWAGGREQACVEVNHLEHSQI